MAVATSTGRSGARQLFELMARDPAVSAHIERSKAADGFLRYCTWNNLPVDHEAYFERRKGWVQDALDSNRTYFEANPYFSLSIGELVERFDTRVIVLLRKPEGVVNSLYMKGWYEQAPTRRSSGFAAGMPPDVSPHHALGRVMPLGEEFGRWASLTRIGKIAWYWNTFTLQMLEQTGLLPADQYRRVRIEDFDYDVYEQLHGWVGGVRPVTRREFDRVAKVPPGRATARRTSGDWSEAERRDFLTETAPARQLLEYGDPPRSA